LNKYLIDFSAENPTLKREHKTALEDKYFAEGIAIDQKDKV